MDESLHAGIYVRVSRKEQASDEHFSIPAQLRETRKFIESKGWIVADEYIDKGYTGRNDRRPQFRRMMADVKTDYQRFMDHVQMEPRYRDMIWGGTAAKIFGLEE